VIKGSSLRQKILVHFLVEITQLFITKFSFKLRMYGHINVVYGYALEEMSLHPLSPLVLHRVE
jgi:hypothetical protein